MACHYPIAAWRALEPNKDTGKYPVVFSPPKHIRKEAESLNLPCGKCVGCRADQAMMWSIRAYHESTSHLANSFLTLTYDDDHLPWDGKISKPDLQNFFKRMRHHYKLRYIACGEYGELTRRPHYHAIIFGQDFDEAGFCSRLDENSYTNSFLEKTWGLGHVMVAPCNLASIMYVCGYVNKKIGDVDTFSLASRRPYIGHDWLKRYSDDIRRTGCVVISGRKFVVPQRYLDADWEGIDDVKAQRKAFAKAKTLKAKPLWEARSKERARRAKLGLKKEKL